MDLFSLCWNTSVLTLMVSDCCCPPVSSITALIITTPIVTVSMYIGFLLLSKNYRVFIEFRQISLTSSLEREQLYSRNQEGTEVKERPLS